MEVAAPELIWKQDEMPQGLTDLGDYWRVGKAVYNGLVLAGAKGDLVKLTRAELKRRRML